MSCLLKFAAQIGRLKLKSQMAWYILLAALPWLDGQLLCLETLIYYLDLPRGTKVQHVLEIFAAFFVGIGKVGVGTGYPELTQWLTDEATRYKGRSSWSWTKMSKREVYGRVGYILRGINAIDLAMCPHAYKPCVMCKFVLEHEERYTSSSDMEEEEEEEEEGEGKGKAEAQGGAAATGGDASPSLLLE